MPDRQALQGSGPILVNILEIVKILANRFIEGVTLNEHSLSTIGAHLLEEFWSSVASIVSRFLSIIGSPLNMTWVFS